jgi:hypothetical protein
MRFSVWLVLFVLVVGCVLMGCGTFGAPAPTPTPAFVTRTFTPTLAPTATFTPPPTSTPTREPTATVTPLPTFTPTRLPPPTATPFPGWKKLESATIELWAPSHFVGGDPLKDKDAIVKSLRALGPEYVNSYNVVEQHADLFLLYALDPQVGSTGLLTTFSVTFNRLLPSGLMDQTQSGVAWQLPRQTILLDSRNVALHYAAERRVVDAVAHNNLVRYLVYTIKSTNYAWVLVFATPENEFYTRLPIFEQIALTLRIKQ